MTTPTEPQEPAPNRRAAGFATFALTAAAIGVVAATGWTVLQACGLRVGGNEMRFPWCEAPQPVAALQQEDLRRDLLQNEIDRLQLALLSPEHCGAPVAPPLPLPPEPEPEPEQAELPPPPPEPLPVEEPPEPEPEPEPRMAEAPAPERRPAPPPPPPQQVAEAQPPQQQRPRLRDDFECPPGQVAQDPSEIMVVLDASGSMRDGINAPSRGGIQFGGILGEVMRNSGNGLYGPSRMNMAKGALQGAIRSAPPGPIGMVSLHDCGQIINHGRYGTQQRGALMNRVQRIRPDQGTPLARAILQAANSMGGGRSPSDPVNMLVISDGEDSCGGNPCRAAQIAKSQRPGLVINVVDLGNTPRLRCVAQATGGFYRRKTGSVDLSNLTRTMQEAAGFQGRGLCRKPG
ncbi:MAG: hypothetical protein AAFV62_09845 [Pseudomonadota bacterium]